MKDRKKRNIPLPTSLGRNIKILRKLKKWTQTELANKLGISRNNVAAYEAGKSEPNAALFLQIADLFNVSEHSLLATDVLDLSVAESADYLAELTLSPDKLQEIKERTIELQSVLDGFTSLELYRAEQDDYNAEIDSDDMHEDFMQLIGFLIQNNKALLAANNIHLDDYTKDQTDNAQ